MSKPNKTVGNFRTKNGFGWSEEVMAERKAASDARMAHSAKTNWASWAMSKVSDGVVFATEADAMAAFEVRPDSERV